ncbi:hypothetical protein RRG08_038604 [Elysia crispata]|uniref:Saposin B-type domain-containing protein n=1 Tax=Elysia crispata TaxID=231223 RepID=A0AAE1AST3_9GAST|nr:hypothetical protein RRG08_038604 [Elysia crispata]
MGPIRAILFCAIVGIAFSTEGSQIQQTKIKENKLCEDCRAFVQDMDDMFLGPGMEENIMERVEKMCVRLPKKVGKFCDEVFTDWIENAFKFVDKLANPDVICNTLPFCGNDEELILEQQVTDNVKEGPVCTLCEEVLGQITSLVTDRRLQSDIEDFMQTFLCAYLPTPLSGMCKDEVNSVLETIFGVLDGTKLDSKIFCSAFGLCQGPGPARRVLLEKVLSQAKLFHKMVQKYSSLLHHVIDQDWTPVLTSAIHVISNKQPKATEGDGPLCDMCEGFLSDISALATSDDFRKDIEEFTEGLTCAFLPTPFNGICKDEIDRLTDIFFDFFRTQLVSDNICKIIGLCAPADELLLKVGQVITNSKVSSGLSHVVQHVTQQNWSPVLRHFEPVLKKAVAPKVVAEDVKESPQCTLCKEVMGQFEAVFANSELKADVERISEGIMCTFLPGDLGKLCKSEVDRFTDLIFDMLALSMNASNICEMTGICRAPDDLVKSLANFLAPSMPIFGKEPVTPLLKSKDVERDSSSSADASVGESPQCTLCKTVVGQFDNMLLNTGLKEGIEYVIKLSVCGLLPGKLGTVCKAEVDNFTEAIFDLVNLSLNASIICDMVGICWGPNQLEENLSHNLIPVIQNLAKVIKPVASLLEKMNEDQEIPVIEHVSTFITEKYPHLRITEASINDAACNVCRRVMELFQQLMADMKFKDDVEEMAAEFLCPIFPKTFQGMCKMEINQIISTLFDMLDSEMDVSMMCDFLGMCQDDGSHYTLQKMLSSVPIALQKMAEAALPTLQRLQKIKTEQGQCALCEIIMEQVFNFLRNDNSRSKVVALGVKYCDMLAEPLSTQCEMYVDQNTARLMDKIVEGLTPKMVCTSVTMCDSKEKEQTSSDAPQNQPKGLMTILSASQEVQTNQPIPKIEETVLKVKREHRAPWCDICEEVSSTVNAFIGSQELLRVAISIGDSICMLMPTGLKYPCDTFIRTFFDEFLGDVSSFMTPDFVCGVIGVCFIEFTPMNYTNSQYLHPSFHTVP